MCGACGARTHVGVVVEGALAARLEHKPGALVEIVEVVVVVEADPGRHPRRGRQQGRRRRAVVGAAAVRVVGQRLLPRHGGAAGRRAEARERRRRVGGGPAVRPGVAAPVRRRVVLRRGCVIVRVSRAVVPARFTSLCVGVVVRARRLVVVGRPRRRVVGVRRHGSKGAGRTDWWGPAAGAAAGWESCVLWGMRTRVGRRRLVLEPLEAPCLVSPDVGFVCVLWPLRHSPRSTTDSLTATRGY